MKTNMKAWMVALVLGLSMGLLSCGGGETSQGAKDGETHSGEHAGHNDGEATETSSGDKAAAKAVVAAYLKVKDALVETDAAETSGAAKALVAALGGSSDERSKKIEKHATSIAALKDVEEQRAEFELLSIEVYELAASADVGMTLYKQYCPMAFDNKGAFWLSAEEEIMNPYFGDMMLHCGKIQEEI